MFRFKQFSLADGRCGMKIGTDAVAVGALARGPERCLRVADIGAGCGVIALMLAQRMPSATFDAVEIDPGACADLRENIAASPWPDRVRAVDGSFCSLEGQYDLIVSNPPYYMNGEAAPDRARAGARHAGTLSALSLADFAAFHLAPDGILAVIVPAELAEATEARAAFNRLALSRRIDIITSARRGVSRTFLEFSADRSVIPSIATLAVGSDEWKTLTAEYYL